MMLDLESGKIKDFIKFEIGQLCMATGGSNRGRVGTIVHKEKHKGSFDIVLIRDSAGQEFATRCVARGQNAHLWGRGGGAAGKKCGVLLGLRLIGLGEFLKRRAMRVVKG